ncbi:MAG: hypothetical protein ACRBBN_13555 [Methyloligellaceae bacterium]
MKKLFVLISTLAVLAMAATAPAQAGSCASKKVYTTGSKALTWAGARVRAKTKWRAKVIGTYGAPYASWVLARSKSLNCWKSGVSKQCKAGGRPCRPL